MLKFGAISLGIAVAISILSVPLSLAGIANFGPCGPNGTGMVLLLAILLAGGIGAILLAGGLVQLAILKISPLFQKPPDSNPEI